MADLQVNHVVHCPDCEHGRLTTRDKAASHQGRHACPNCNRGLATRPLSAAGPKIRAKLDMSKADTVAKSTAPAPADD